MASYTRARIEVQKNGVWQLVKWPEIYNPANYGPSFSWKMKVFFKRLASIRKTYKLYVGMKIKNPFKETIKGLFEFGGCRKKPKTYKINGLKYYLESEIEISSFRRYEDAIEGNPGVPSDASFELQVLIDDDNHDEYVKHSYKWKNFYELEDFLDNRVHNIKEMINVVGLNKKIDKILDKLDIEKDEEDEDEYVIVDREYIDEETIDDYIWETRRICEFIGMVKRVVELSEREYYIDEKIRIIYSIC